MNKKDIEKLIMPVKDRDDANLVELVCQLNGRLTLYPSESMHKAYWEARNELHSRLAGYAASTPSSEQGSDGWISVEDRLPQKMEEVLFTHTDVRDWGGNKVKPSISFGWYDRDKFHSYIDPRDNWSATHWMPLPPTPPQSKE